MTILFQTVRSVFFVCQSSFRHCRLIKISSNTKQHTFANTENGNYRTFWSLLNAKKGKDLAIWNGKLWHERSTCNRWTSTDWSFCMKRDHRRLTAFVDALTMHVGSPHTPLSFRRFTYEHRYYSIVSRLVRHCRVCAPWYNNFSEQEQKRAPETEIASSPRERKTRWVENELGLKLRDNDRLLCVDTATCFHSFCRRMDPFISKWITDFSMISYWS